MTENYDATKYVILDIETTGLSPKYSQVILVGFIIYIDKQWYLIQLLCDHRQEEDKLLKELIQYFNHDHMLITYNGHSFDLPYLNKRLKHHKIDFQFDPFMNFDLYRVVRSAKQSLGINNYKLKSIEKYLGILRDDTISGKESVELYNLFEKNQNQKLKNKIMLHNYEDIKFLIPTLKILEHIPTEITDNFYPFTLKSSTYGLIKIETFKLSDSYLSIVFNTRKKFQNFNDYNESYTYTVNFLDDKWHIGITLPTFMIQGDVAYRFIDIDSLAFLNKEFNDMDYQDQLQYLVTSKKETVIKVIDLFDQHYSF